MEEFCRVLNLVSGIGEKTDNKIVVDDIYINNYSCIHIVAVQRLFNCLLREVTIHPWVNLHRIRSWYALNLHAAQLLFVALPFPTPKSIIYRRVGIGVLGKWSGILGLRGK